MDIDLLIRNARIAACDDDDLQPCRRRASSQSRTAASPRSGPMTGLAHRPACQAPRSTPKAPC